MKRSIVIAVCAGLAACSGHGAGNNQQAGSSGGVTGAVSNAVSGAVSAVSGGASQIQPGRWETTMQIVHMDMPNMPPQMRDQMNQPITGTTCITPEKAAHPLEYLNAHSREQGCSSNDISMANGHMTGTMVCPDMRATINGTFTATTYDVTTQAQVNHGGQSSNIETHTTSRRVGECNGTEDTGNDDAGAAPPAPPAAPGGGK